MAQVSVSINRRNYRIACDDGQEAHLTELAGLVDERVAELVEAVGQIGDTRLMVMTSLLIADELADANVEIKAIRKDRDATDASLGAVDDIAAEVDGLAGRIDTVAARLEGA